MTQAERRHDRLAVRLSLIISRLVAGETLNMAQLAAEFGVSVRTLRRDFRERLMYLDLEYRRGAMPPAQHWWRRTGRAGCADLRAPGRTGRYFSGAGPASGGHAAHCRRDAMSGMAAATVCVTGQLTGVLPSCQCHYRLPAGTAAGRGRAL